MVIREEWENTYPESTIFENPSFETALIGHTEDGRAVYDYDLMVQDLAAEMQENGSEDPETEAIEWIDYNTIRAMPYMPNPPIIIYLFE